MNQDRKKSPNATSPYRWVVLGVYALITILIEMQWLTFAPIAREARSAYGVSALKIDILSMVFMAVFLVACIPASYVMDRRGIRVGVGIGAVLTGVFGVMKGIFAADYGLILAAQIGLAVAQPFILNAATGVAARWFPIGERATAVGVATLAQFVGIIVVMVATPALVAPDSTGRYDLRPMLQLYGIFAAIGALLLVVLMRERPAAAGNDTATEERLSLSDGFRLILGNRDMRITLALFFIGLGIFNAVSTCVDQLCEKKGFTTEQTGMVGGIMLITGIVGAIILPPLSDKLKRRKPFLVAAMLLMAPGLAGMTIFGDYVLVLASAGVFGFFLLGAGAPVGFQYSAEMGRPVPESVSQGIILLTGQVSGIVFIAGINAAGITAFMVLFIALAAINVFLALLLKESTMMDAPGGTGA